MYQPLAAADLKTGERMEAGVVRAPDREWAPRLVPFLGHKTDAYRAHLRRALVEELDALETRFYVGHVGGRLLSQAMVVGSRGVGILGHVYTLPEERRKGACAAVLQALMADCRAAGFGVLCLGTGYNTPPYHLYRTVGFEGVAPGSGCMIWEAEPGAQAALFAPGPASIREARWDDWAYFDLLAKQPLAEDEELPRSAVLGLKGQSNAEGPFVRFQALREQEPRIQARALVSELGATAGWALLAPDPRWFGDVWVLDLHAHRSFTERLPDLAFSVDLPDAPVAAYLTEPEGPKAAALHAAGFRRHAALPAWLPVGGTGRRTIAVWRRG
jgi:hypothetical protein